MVQKNSLTKPVCISGPTASGKSDLALALAEKYEVPIISADSMQIYKGMDIGTAKPSASDRRKVRHFMIDIIEPDRPFNAFMFVKETERILSETGAAIVAGGTGLYFESLLYGLDYPTGTGNEAFRQSLWDYTEKNGQDALYAMLVEQNPEKTKKIHPNNIKGVIRALEILQTDTPAVKGRVKKHDYPLFALNVERPLLYERINKRVDAMIEKGLVSEAEILKKKYGDASQAFQAIGYKEIFDYLEGKTEIGQAVDLIKQHTRNYAKRQITFLKRLNPIWLDASKNIEELITEIENYI